MAKLFSTDPKCGNCAHGPDATTQPTNGFWNALLAKESWLRCSQNARKSIKKGLKTWRFGPFGPSLATGSKILKSTHYFWTRASEGRRRLLMAHNPSTPHARERRKIKMSSDRPKKYSKSVFFQKGKLRCNGFRYDGYMTWPIQSAGLEDDTLLNIFLQKKVKSDRNFCVRDCSEDLLLFWVESTQK